MFTRSIQQNHVALLAQNRTWLLAGNTTFIVTLMTLCIVRADYLNPQHGSAIADLLDAYASSPMGGGMSLADSVLSNIAGELAKLPHAITFLCYSGDVAVGLINCFEGFSTFKARKLINIHDVFVAADYRGLGISRLLISAVESLAIDRECCKLTLEVLEGNTVAKQAYINMGFNSYELDVSKGIALFWEKPLS
ncbi:MAG: GNAT family N-acetyltransferase [Oceanicoccus sp.]